MFTLKSSCKGENYRKFIDILSDFSDEASVIARRPDDLSVHGKKLLTLIQTKGFGSEKKTKEWPGTITSGNEVSLYRFRLSDEVIECLKLPNSLNVWLEPELPEDLTFYIDGKPLFVSTSHENDFYVPDGAAIPDGMLERLKQEGLELVQD